MNRIFIDDPQLVRTKMTELLFTLNGVDLWAINSLSTHEEFSGMTLPPKIYVADFPRPGHDCGHQFLKNRQFCGMIKFNLITETAHGMIRLLHKTTAITGHKRTQAKILWGGYAMDLLFAIPRIFDYMIDTILIKLTRKDHENPPDPDDPFSVEEGQRIGNYWRSDVYYVEEECIASGKSVRKFLELLKEHGSLPDTFVLFPICGSLKGVERIYKACLEMGRNLVVIYNSAIFEVAKKGVDKDYTDLGLKPHTIVTSAFYRELYERYQGTDICVVGDIGDSIHLPIDHYAETLHHMRVKGFDPRKENWRTWDLTVLLSTILSSKLKDHDPETYNYVREIFHILRGEFHDIPQYPTFNSYVPYPAGFEPKESSDQIGNEVY